MPAPTPATDPLWAYDTPGWTNQGNTGDIPNVASLGSTALLGPNEAIIQNYIAMTLDPNAFTHAAALMTSGTTYGAKVVLAAPAFVTNVSVWATAAGTATLFFTGIYNINGTLLSTSADLHASLGSGVLVTGAQTATIALAAGIYYLACCEVTGSTTSVDAITAAASATTFGGQNLAIPAASTPFGNGSPRWVALGTGATTALPASIVPHSATFSTVGFWAALS